MGSERSRAVAVAAAAIVSILALIALPATAAQASEWWRPLGLRGVAVTGVTADRGTLTVRTGAGATLRSTDGGATFSADAGSPPPAAAGRVVSNGDTWEIDASGSVRHGLPGRSPAPDPGAPALGAGANLIAAPVLPGGPAGVVIAVGTDGTVWRRGEDGDWKRALLLLPQSLLQGVPAVTSLTAFSRPLTNAVYLGTAGYAVLISTDGGDDWIRAGPGLPDDVLALAADASTRSVYAGTSDGIWVHALQAFPAPPAYSDADLVWRWLGIAAVSLLAALAGALGLVRLLPR